VQQCRKFAGGKLSDQASSRIKELKIIAFRSLKNVRIFVDQTYNSGEIKSIKLPYENTASKLLRYAGIKTNITYDNTYSGTLTIKAEGYSRSSDYTGSISGKQYSGASVSGNFSFEIQNNFIYERSFNGSVSPPLFIQSKYQSPASAPFSAAFAKSNFTLELLRIIRDVFGHDPLIMALKDETLKKITSENFETDHEKWQDWWEKNKNMD
jgi:hypothetical protein